MSAVFIAGAILHRTYYENRNEEYSLHLTEESAEAGARAMLYEDMDIAGTDPVEPGGTETFDDLSFDELFDCLVEANGPYIGTREIEVQA